MSAGLLARRPMPPADQLPRLLAGATAGPVDLVGHHRLHGELPTAVDVTGIVEQSRLWVAVARRSRWPASSRRFELP
jgi:hypothetical protein